MSVVGTYRHRVRLETPGPPVPDGDGGYLESWTPLNPAEWDCSIEAATVRDLERMVAGAVQATATHLVRGRYHPGIAIDTRITVRESRLLYVQYVSDVEERQIALVLVCAEQLKGSHGEQARNADRRVARRAPSVARELTE